MFELGNHTFRIDGHKWLKVFLEVSAPEVDFNVLKSILHKRARIRDVWRWPLIEKLFHKDGADAVVITGDVIEAETFV